MTLHKFKIKTWGIDREKVKRNQNPICTILQEGCYILDINAIYIYIKTKPMKQVSNILEVLRHVKAQHFQLSHMN